MSTETVKLIQGDAGPNIQLTLKDKNTGDPSDPDSWDPIDLSAATTTISANVRLKGALVIYETAPCFKVGDGSAGQILYIPSNALMAEALGSYEVEIYIDFNGAIQTIHNNVNMKLTEQF